MKKLVMLVMIVLVQVISYGAAEKKITVYGMNEEKILIKENGKMGYMDLNGKKIIECKYEDAILFFEGLAGVKKNGKWGFIDESGKTVIDFKYDEVSGFTDGMANIKKGNKWGIIDKKGMEIVIPKYEEIWSFKEGMAVVKRNNKYGYINEKGKEVVIPKYNLTFGYINGMAVVANNNKYGMIDSTGKEVIPLIYDYCSEINSERICVMKKNKNGYIDKTGKMVITMIYDSASEFSKNGNATVQLNGKWGIINKDGKVVIPLKYDNSVYFFGEVEQLMTTAPIIFIDKEGKIIKEYSYYESIGEGSGIVKEKNKEKVENSYDRKDCILDKMGKEITPFKYFFVNDAMVDSVDNYEYELPEFINGYSMVKYLKDDGDIYGLIDKTGKEILLLEYNWVYNATGDSGLVVDKFSKKLGVYKIKNNKAEINWIFNGMVKH